MKYLGIDLGGTTVAAAVVDSEGTILGKVSLPTPRGAEAVADQMAAAARGAAEAAGTALDEVASVGIGAPGAIEPDTGVIKYWSNLDFTNVPITALMKARLRSCWRTTPTPLPWGSTPRALARAASPWWPSPWAPA